MTSCIIIHVFKADKLTNTYYTSKTQADTPQKKDDGMGETEAEMASTGICVQ